MTVGGMMIGTSMLIRPNSKRNDHDNTSTWLFFLFFFSFQFSRAFDTLLTARHYRIEYYQAINDTLGDNGRKYRFGDSASRWSVHGMLDTDALQGEWARSVLHPTYINLLEHQTNTNSKLYQLALGPSLPLYRKVG